MDDAERELLNAFRYPGNKEKALRFLPKVSDPRKILDNYSQCLLHFAGDRGWQDVIELLITEYNFDPHYEDEYGGTALRDACARGFTDLARYLVKECCVDPTKKDNNGISPLDESRNWGHHKTTKCLETIIDDAKKCGYEDVGQYLRDQSAQSALTKAMQKGGGQLRQSNITMHGPPGAGKTSVKRLIVGLPPLPKKDQNATDIMEKGVRAVCTSTLKNFEIISNAELIEMLAKEIKNQQVKKEVVKPHQKIPSSDENDSNEQPIAQTHSKTSEKSDSLASSNSSSSAEISEESEVLGKLHELLKVSKPSSSMFDSQWFHLVDSGGQPQFSDILPLVYSSPSLHIVVIRLTEELEDKPKVLFYTEGEPSYSLPNNLCLTNREFIVRTCQIACSTATDGFTPYVMVVATHKDLFGNECEARIKHIDQGLADVRKEFGNVLICKSRDETVFAVNAIAEDEERDQYTEELQEVIKKMGTKSTEPTNIPLKWLAYHLDLGESDGVVRMSECYRKGKLLGMNEADVRNVLMFLNRVALILYFPKDIPGFILTKMDPFIGPLSNLVKRSFIPQKFCTPYQSERLREKGLFEKAFVREVLGDFKTSSLDENEFIELLVCLKIAVHVRGEVYFLPSALSLEPFPESSFKMSSNPLAFTWGKRILPHGFFFTVIVELLGNVIECDGLYSFELRTDITQWRGEIQVSEVGGKIPGVIKLTDRKHWIQLSYSDDTIYCVTVRQVVNTAMQKAIQRFEHTRICIPDTEHLCPLCEKKDHYCLMSADKRKVTCSLKKIKTGPVMDNMLCWVEVRDQATNLPPVDDTMLSEDDLLDVFESTAEVGDWKSLGLKLGLKNSLLESIEREEHTEDRCRRNMLAQWLKRCHDASWNTLVKSLNSSSVDSRNLARRIAEQHQKHS